MNIETYLDAMELAVTIWENMRLEEYKRRKRRLRQYWAFRAHLIQRDERMKLALANAKDQTKKNDAALRLFDKLERDAAKEEE